MHFAGQNVAPVQFIVDVPSQHVVLHLMSIAIVLGIQVITMSLQRNQCSMSGSFGFAGSLKLPSMNPSLFLIRNALFIDRAHE